MSMSMSRISVAVGIVIVMVLSAAPGLVRGFPTPPTAVAIASTAMDELSAVPPGTEILFNGLSSTPGAGGTLVYTWYFGDSGSSGLPVVSHSFTADGIYDVTLVVQESTGMMALDTVRVFITSPIYGSGGVNGAVIGATPSILGTVTEDTTITFDCRNSWPPAYDRNLLTCAWDFGDDGTATIQVATHTYAYAGTYTVRLVVRDAAGNADTETATVTVVNQVPVAPSPAFTWTPASPVEDTYVLFDATDGWDTATDNMFLALGFAWDFGDGGRGSGDQAAHTYNQPGTYTVTVTATDDNGATATATRTDVIVGNVPPTASATTLMIKEAETARFDATTSTDTASDAGSLTYAWTGGATLSGTRPTAVWYDEATPSMTLTVTDTHSASSTASPSVTVQNRAPYASITNAVKSGSSIIATGVVHEVGADSLTLTWAWGHGSPPSTSTQTFTNTAGTSPFRVTWSPTHAFPSTSTWYTVTLTATDGDGGSHVATASIKGGGSGSVIDNKAPDVTAVNADQTSKAEDVAFSFTATVSNPDGPSSPATTYLWEFGDGTTATTASASHAYARAGTYTVILKATDGAGDSGANSRQVTATNNAPTAAFTVNQPSPYEDDSITFTATPGTDTASDSAALRYAWDFGDGGRASGSPVTHAYRTPGTRTVTLTVTDDNAASPAPATQSVTVTSRPPTADFEIYTVTSGSGSSAAIATGSPPSPPANPKERHMALFSAITSYDSPSDDTLLTHSWDFGDGTPAATGLNVMHSYASQGTYNVRLTVTDLHGLTDSEPDTVTGQPITVDDTAAIAMAGPDKKTYGATALLHFRASAEDDDSEVLTYLWNFDVTCGPPLVCPMGAGPDAYYAYIATGIYTVLLTVTDASGSSATDTLTVTVNMDSDGDQLSDECETGLVPCGLPGPLDPFDPDTDDDFLLDYIEAFYGTDPTTDDSDNDGLNDWEELFLGDDGYQTDPLDADTDGDVLGDGMENGLQNPVTQGWTFHTDLFLWDGQMHGGVVYGPDQDPLTKTNPTDPDTENDGLPDGWIDGANGNLLDGLKQVGEFEDRDLDGRVTLGAWNSGGGPGETDPNAIDTDNDGVADSVEEGIPGIDLDTATLTNPLDDDSDDDGVLDGVEDIDGDGRRDGNDPSDTESDWNGNEGPGEMDPLDADTDGDHLSDGLEVGLTAPMGTGTAAPPWNIPPAGAGAVGYGPDSASDSRTDPLDIDTDDDAIPDGWVDLDSDTLVDAIETEDRDYDGRVTPGAWNGGNGPGETDPTTFDTDSDEWKDKDEILVFLTNPLLTDTDSDGIRDGREFITDPVDADTDDDGLKDGTEDRNGDGFREGNDPTDATSDWGGGAGTGETDPMEFDTDNDGLSDGLESGLAAAQFPPDTDPAIFVADSDAGVTKTDPLHPDSDADSLPDGLEDANHNGAVSTAETNPNVADTDGDELADGEEDGDHDGLVNAGETDPRNGDSEPGGGDGMPDGWEVEHFLFPLIADASVDSDGDGLANLQEYAASTDPQSDDSDLDFILDGDDVAPAVYTIDPNRPLVVPGVTFVPDLIAIADVGILHVSVALDFAIPDPDATITIGPSPRTFTDAEHLGLLGDEIRVGTSSIQSYSAVVKFQYSSPPPGDERFLLTYRWQGDTGGEWSPMMHTYAGEQTWRDTAHDYVWAFTSDLGDFAVADSMLNNFDGDGWADGSEFDVAEYDPWVNKLCVAATDAMCDVTGNERSAWTLFETAGGDVTLYLRVPVKRGAREAIVATNDEGGSPKVKLWTDDAWSESKQSVGTSPDTIGVVDAHWIAAPFRLAAGGGSELLGAVDLPLVVLEAAEFILDVRATEPPDEPSPEIDALGPPGAPIAGSEVHQTLGVSDPFQWFRFEFPTPIALSLGATYWVTLHHLGSVTQGWQRTTDTFSSWQKWAIRGDPGSWAVFDDTVPPAFRLLPPLPHDVTIDIGSAGAEWPDTLPPPVIFDAPNGEEVFFTDDLPLLNQLLDECASGVCPDADGTDFISFRFHSSTQGHLIVDNINFLVEAVPITPADLFDTDADGLSNAVEFASADCLGDVDSNDLPGPWGPDMDGDGILDGEETRWWEDTDIDGLINSCDPDSDGDGLHDGLEITTNPLAVDTDGDTIWDGIEDSNHDGAKGTIETDPRLADTDSDGLTDAAEDLDGDHAYEPFSIREPDPLDSDSDDDGLLDGEEPNWAQDTDSDSLINARDGDSDNDAYVDWDEVNEAPRTLTYYRLLAVGGKTYTVTHGGVTDSVPGDGTGRSYDGAAFDVTQDWVIDASPGDDGDYTMVNVGIPGGGAISGNLLVWDLGLFQIISLSVTARPSPLIRDTDGDGVMDGWEANGVDRLGDGVFEVPLPAYGADPITRNIFVEVDQMSAVLESHGHDFPQDQQDRVSRAFLVARLGMLYQVW